MPTFEGSLQLAGDAGTKMPAGIRIDGGRLVLLAGANEEIGSWNLSQLEIFRKSGAFVFDAEGEQIMITVEEPEAFVRLIDLQDDSATPPPVPKERRSRRQKKQRPPKEPKRSRAEKKAAKVETPPPATPAEEPAPVPSYLVEPEPAAPTPATPFETPAATEPEKAPRPKREKKAKAPKEKTAKPEKISLFAALPLSWKIGAGVVLAAIVLGIFAPEILTAILMLSGMLTLLLAVVVGTDSIAAARLPSAMTSTNTLVAGVILLVLSALLMVIT